MVNFEANYDVIRSLREVHINQEELPSKLWTNHILTGIDICFNQRQVLLILFFAVLFEYNTIDWTKW